jgi:hypothetical protein
MAEPVKMSDRKYVFLTPEEQKDVDTHHAAFNTELSEIARVAQTGNASVSSRRARFDRHLEQRLREKDPDFLELDREQATNAPVGYFKRVVPTPEVKNDQPKSAL